jgi:hypothetical protein
LRLQILGGGVHKCCTHFLLGMKRGRKTGRTSEQKRTRRPSSTANCIKKEDSLIPSSDADIQITDRQNVEKGLKMSTSTDPLLTSPQKDR